jgi:hypothetical protein
MVPPLKGARFVPGHKKTALQAATQAFVSVGLPLPPIPSRFAESFRVIEPWCFSSRKISGMAMYFFDRYWKEPVVRKTQSYVAFCHAGHGINSYAITYQLVDSPLALFVQEGFGGGYSDKRRDRQSVKAMFDRCATLIAAVDEARARGLSGPGRLLVVESPMRDLCGWGWLERTLPSGAEARVWWDAHRVESRDYPPGQHRLALDHLPTVAARRWVSETAFQRSGRSA